MAIAKSPTPVSGNKVPGKFRAGLRPSGLLRRGRGRAGRWVVFWGVKNLRNGKSLVFFRWFVFVVFSFCLVLFCFLNVFCGFDSGFELILIKLRFLSWGMVFGHPNCS